MLKNPFYKILFWSFACAVLVHVPSCAVQKNQKNKVEDNRSAEEKFVDENFTPVNCSLWEKGKRFFFVGDRLNITFKPLDRSSAIVDEKAYANKIFVFDSIQEEVSYDMKKYATLIFDCEGEKFVFETKKSLEEIKTTDYTPLIPNLISLDEIENANKILYGQTLYIRTALWYNENGERISGRKLVPVKVEKVEIGNFILPAKLTFTDDSGFKASIFILFSSKSNSGENLTFDRVFTFENPRLKYPDIKDENWKLITQERLALGMTKPECKLSLGNPREVDKIPTYDGLREQWSYSAGSYLVFENGILTRFRL